MKMYESQFCLYVTQVDLAMKFIAHSRTREHEQTDDDCDETEIPSISQFREL